jgi:hypothetical protein
MSLGSQAGASLRHQRRRAPTPCRGEAVERLGRRDGDARVEKTASPHLPHRRSQAGDLGGELDRRYKMAPSISGEGERDII